MLPVLHGDVSAAARALLRAPVDGRGRLCRRMIGEAAQACAHVRKTGSLHPLYGNGSLMSAARKRELADEPSFDDPEYCQCFEMVLREITLFRISPKRS
ncbi:DUF7742 family protein [Lutimaribacter marinistellae]